MSCGVGCRHGLDPPLLWLWCRLVAAAPIGPLAWEPPYATGVVLGRQKKTPPPQKKFNYNIIFLHITITKIYMQKEKEERKTIVNSTSKK